MRFGMQDIALAGDLIVSTLSYLIEMGIIDIDLCEVNVGCSAMAALEKDYLDENLPDDEIKTCEGLLRKGVRYLKSAVYFDGKPVIREDLDIVCPEPVGQTQDGDYPRLFCGLTADWIATLRSQ